MARKKSAAKKAREEAAKLESDKGAQETPKPIQEVVSPVENDPAESSDESSEEEDEYGELLTENVELLIKKVMETLKTDPKKLLDPESKFFQEDDSSSGKKSKDKPIYLKDYHRMNLLSGDYKNLEDENSNEYGTVDGEKPYVVTEREERNKLLDDIKSAFNGDEEDDDEDGDGFLKKKDNATTRTETEKSIPLPDPTKGAEEFLSAFLDNQAWIPKKDDKVINLDQIDNDDEQAFDDAVEDLERAYNFRFEDPNSASIVSYARTQASLRRGKTNSRKRARDKKNAIKEQEKHETEQALKKKKTSKVNKVMDRLAKIKEAVGEDISDETIEKVFGDSLLNDDFDDADWDGKMAEIFNEQYYDAEMTKPEWDEDDEIMADYHKEKEDEEVVDEDAEIDENEDDEQLDAQAPPKKKSKKDQLKEKKSAKKEKKTLKEKAEKIVEANKTRLLDEVEEERGRNKQDDPNRFRYREVSPESFGLSTREIFLADDLELNKFISIKKFAPYKPKEAALKDKRKFTKKKHLQQWRREVFSNKEGPEKQKEEGDDEIWIPIEEESRSRK